MMRRILRLVIVSDGSEVNRLRLQPDGTVAVTHPDGTPAGDGSEGRDALRTRMRENGETEAEAFAALDREGWSNGDTMIALAG